MPVFRAPAGTVIGSKAVGGRFLSPAQIRTASIPAAAGTDYTVGPYAKLSSRFPAIIAGLQIRCNVVSRDTAEAILEDAQANLSDAGEHPYATGALEASLYLVDLPLEEGWAVATDMHYAPYVEFGTARSAPHPFLVPAIEAHDDGFIKDTALALQRL